METANRYEKLERINQDFVHSAQLGDITALNKLLVNNEPVIRTFLFKKLYKDKSDLDDLVQESMMKLSTGLHGYDHTRPFIRYVFQLSNQVFIDYLRDIYRFNPIYTTANLDFSETICGVEDDFIQVENITVMKQLVNKTISEFKNDEMKKVMMMMAFDQLTNKEIVQRTGLSESFVKTLISRGRKILKNKLS